VLIDLRLGQNPEEGRFAYLRQANNAGFHSGSIVVVTQKVRCGQVF
jgi:hypothetical protein